MWKQNVTGSFRHNAYVYWSPADDKFLLWSIGVDVPDPKQCGGINKYVESFEMLTGTYIVQGAVAEQYLCLLGAHDPWSMVTV